MKIDEIYSIEKDGSSSFRLVKTRANTVDPSKTISTHTYHTSIPACLKSYVRHSIGDCKEIKDIQTKLDEVYELIDNLKW